MPKTLISKNAAQLLNPKVLAFKPRPLLLFQSNTTTMKKEDNNNNNNNNNNHNNECKATIFRSVARFLERSGFSKTLKKFRSEAHFQEDTLGDPSFDLEEVFIKFLEIRDQGSKDLSKLPAMQSDNITHDVVSTGTEPKEKKNKNNADSLTKEEQFSSEALEHPANNISSKPPKQKDKKKSKSESESLDDVSFQPPSETATKANKENLEAVAISDGKKLRDSETENKSKGKKQKKEKKKPSGSAVADKVEQPVSKGEQLADGKKFEEAQCLKYPKVIDFDLVDYIGNHSENKDFKSKKKKKKSKIQAVSEILCNGNSDKLEAEKANGTEAEQDGLKISDKHAKDKQNKGSKKRKWLASEGVTAQLADEKPTEEPKRRKTETSEEAELGEQSRKSTTSKSGGEDQTLLVSESLKGSMNPLEAQANGNLKKHEKICASVNSNKKLDDVSVVPKSVKRFQRVNVEEVVFSNEKLQDNSYWAKDGADIGYGAKAQEVLGQVKGRDFRHEKTKKKRGTYRGGNIDVQSHSIKFNYSDDE